ncbi:uncharacterized protein LOC126848359 isoform X2 [Cataglyphis hispanica]|uniref:uncharacterized protein LOC126848359 isoform X2 n=1 Tax=Cataglyphis hispanica TaxID=1086592 RepID=UPI00217FD636|nr:uncharacterized protein LOC126848359 isoform X2 [Cataglyphis hispanica]
MMEKLIQLKAKHVKIDTLVLQNLLQAESIDKINRSQNQRFNEDEFKIEELTSKVAVIEEKQHTETQNLEHKNNELSKHNVHLAKIEVERKKFLQEIKQLEEKRNNLRSFKPNLSDQQLLELGKKKLKLYKNLTKIQWDYEATKHSVTGYVSNKCDYIHYFCHENQETNDKLVDSLWHEIYLSTNKGSLIG